jgi:7-cyano-7-deazaguanine synthase
MPHPPTAVLTSGGLDSAILVAYEARCGGHVTPLYIRSGLSWEAVELAQLRNYLQAITPQFPNLQQLVVLEQPTQDLYGEHWSTTGQAVPDATTPDEAVYLPGRNLLLTLKGLLWCHLHGVKQLALGVLGSNPFPDASTAFFQHFAAAVGEGVNDPQLRIITPFGKLHKVDVMKHGQGLPLELSFSCIHPVNELHCGQCNKCAERIKAFCDAGMRDLTHYASNR